MANRRDQLFSYQLMVQRVISAFVYRDAELAQVPFRRARRPCSCRPWWAAIMLGSVGIYGLLVKGGNTSWRDPEAVIVEKETGARFVYLDGRFVPGGQLRIGRLILKQRNPRIVLVSTASLVGAPRGGHARHCRRTRLPAADGSTAHRAVDAVLAAGHRCRVRSRRAPLGTVRRPAARRRRAATGRRRGAGTPTGQQRLPRLARRPVPDPGNRRPCSTPSPWGRPRSPR